MYRYRQTDRWIDIQTGRQKGTSRQTNPQPTITNPKSGPQIYYKYIDRYIDRQTDRRRQTNSSVQQNPKQVQRKWIDIMHIDNQIDAHNIQYTWIQTDRQMDRQTDRHIERQIDRQKYKSSTNH